MQQSITIKGLNTMNTRSHQGKHGNTFSFDVFLAEECWTDPGAVEKHLRLNKQGKLTMVKHGSLTQKYTSLQMQSSTRREYWTCPKHVAEHGGQATHYTHGSTFCFHGSAYDRFPEALMILINLCIDDSEIWKIQYEEDKKNFTHVAWMEETQWKTRGF